MNRIYFRLRTALMTFTFGLAAVWMANLFSIAVRDYPVELPSGTSADVLYVFPTEKRNICPSGCCGGGHCYRSRPLTSF